MAFTVSVGEADFAALRALKDNEFLQFAVVTGCLRIASNFASYSVLDEDFSSYLRELIGALWGKDEERAAELLSGLLWDTISYNDYHEDYYHAFLAGVFVGRGYNVESNKGSGLGRPDILLRDKKNRRAIIIESKKSKRKEDLDKDCDKALKQIADEKYAEGVEGYEEILCYGAAFFKKQVKLKIRRQTGR